MFRSLLPDDELLVKDWLHQYLTEHLQWWAEVFGAEPQTKVEDLVERDWQELLESSEKKDAFVTVAGSLSMQR
jgi:hypothetical protein